jgi:hypothetical protein
MTVEVLIPNRPMTGIIATIAIGILMGAGIALGLDIAGPLKLGFAIIGIGLFVPALIIRDPKAYGLFLLVLSVPLVFSIRLTKWLVDPGLLYTQFGLPASGTTSLDLYPTDIILIGLLLLWLGQLSRGEAAFRFPRLGYIYIVFLLYALMIALLRAKSLYLAIFEWVRQIFYFVFFIYIVNNVETRTQLRAVVTALFLGLSVHAAAVVVFFVLGIGTEFNFFSYVIYGTNPAPDPAGSLTVSDSGTWKGVVRSSGFFAHPAHAAFYFEYILPIVFGYFLVARSILGRILPAILFVLGVTALFLTFSRSAIGGFLVGCTIFVCVAWWSRLISSRMFAGFIFAGVIVAIIGTPVLIDIWQTRPRSVSTRWKITKPSVDAFMERPILGAGLNNSSAVTARSHEIALTPTGRSVYQMVVVHNYYLIVLVEVGIIGFLMFFGFFWGVVVATLRHLRAAEPEMKIILCGAIAAMASIAVHNVGDPFGGPSATAMLWLEAGLALAVCRKIAVANVGFGSVRDGATSLLTTNGADASAPAGRHAA